MFNCIWYEEFFCAFYSLPLVVCAPVSTQGPSVMNRKTSAVISPVRMVETAPTITQETHLFVPVNQVFLLFFLIRILIFYFGKKIF